MKSSEVAQLASITVRTLRHYHQLGILPEPGREANGYRQYTTHDLIRVLRIKNLGMAGVPLADTARLIDPGSQRMNCDPFIRDALLAEIDQDLADKIARLTFQRAIIAEARVLNTTPDLPAELFGFDDVYAAGSPELIATVHGQLVLLAHLDQHKGTQHTATLFEQLNHPHIRPHLLALSERFELIGEDSDEGSITALADDFGTFLDSMGHLVLAIQQHWLLEPRLAVLVEHYQRDILNEAQQLVVAAMATYAPLKLDDQHI